MAGVTGRITIEEARLVAEMMVKTGRAVPPQKWVDSLIEAGEIAGLENLY